MYAGGGWAFSTPLVTHRCRQHLTNLNLVFSPLHLVVPGALPEGVADIFVTDEDFGRGGECARAYVGYLWQVCPESRNYTQSTRRV